MRSVPHKAYSFGERLAGVVNMEKKNECFYGNQRLLQMLSVPGLERPCIV